jgi:hypothetical protein
MRHEVQQEIELRRYLLGELPQKDQALVEQRLFLDSDYANLLQAVEDDLIDQYLSDELSGSEREKFKNHFLLLPEHGADLRIAQALKKYLSTEAALPTATATDNTRNDQPRNVPPFSFLNKPIVWLSLTVAALVILSILTWNAFRSIRGPAADAPMQARDPQPSQTRPNDKPQPAPLPNNDNRVETADKGNTNQSGAKPEHSRNPERRVTRTQIATFTLIAGSPIRSVGSSNTVTIHEHTKQVELRLVLEFSAAYEIYRADLLRGERKIDGWHDLKSKADETYGSVVSVPVSAKLLREQSYQIRLKGIPTDQQSAEPPITYLFNVARR